jgi:hypothetical protein
VTRYDILSEKKMESDISQLSLGRFSTSNIEDYQALQHPSNNSIFLIKGGEIYLFDN